MVGSFLRAQRNLPESKFIWQSRLSCSDDSNVDARGLPTKPTPPGMNPTAAPVHRKGRYSDKIPVTVNPSLRAAIARRSSKVTNSSEEGRRSEARYAAASCIASAARSGCTRTNRTAASRRASLASISCQVLASCRRRSSASDTVSSSSTPSRSSRASAETHSTWDPHQTNMVGSLAAIACSRDVFASETSNGTSADVSQNFTGLPAVPRGQRQPPKHPFWGAGVHA